jgi:hypothetical protein
VYALGMKLLQPLPVVVCLSTGIVLGMFADHAIVKAQSQPESSVALWEIYTGSWTGGNSGGYYVVKQNRIIGETLILDRQDNKSSINVETAHWLKLSEEAKQVKK